MHKIPKIEQVALCVPDVKEYAQRLATAFGLDEWVFDTVTGDVSIHPHTMDDQHTSTAILAFNYQLGYEFELLQYVIGPNWHAQRGTDHSTPFLSHWGRHVDSVDVVCDEMREMGFKLIQTMTTRKHTNEYLIKCGRTFKYAIFDTRDFLGFDYKVIERIQPKQESPQDVAAGLEKAAATYRQRAQEYGNNFLNMGAAMAGLFPGGVTLKTPADFTRWHLFELNMVKMSRYAVNFDKGGHPDSLVDATVYPAMLNWADEQARKGKL